ncbi:MAG: PKD domain-containing protein [Microthrixaceae bacterium]|nr:PKD domain-containing protein [Microthrixaceae bacterium]
MVDRSRLTIVQGQSGFSLIEVLVSLVLLSTLIGGISAGIMTVTRASDGSNRSIKANALLSGFGEALQHLSYRNCNTGDLKANYAQAFATYNADLPAGERLVPVGASDVSVTVDAVDPVGGCVGGAPDMGQQILTVSAEVRGVVRTADVVKRDPDYVPTGPDSNPKATLVSASGDPQGVVSLDGSLSTPAAEIVSYAWDCGAGGNTIPVTSDPVDPAAVCTYTASGSSAQTKTISLTVTDQFGVTNTDSVNVVIPKASTARLAPVAVISASPTSGNADLTVTFSPAGSSSLDGSIVKYQWDFGDPLSGSENNAESTTSSTQTHVYRRGGTFTATLVVTDDIGLTGTATVAIVVTKPGPPPPIARFTMSPQPAVAPQTVSFNGTASTDAGGGPVSSYLWDFGDGTTAPGATTTHLYAYPGTYTVRLTVKDASNVSGTTTKELVVGMLTNPANFRMTDARGELAHSGDFYFAWTNPGASAGDSVVYEIEIKAVIGCLAFGSKTRNVTAGAPGSVQTYDFKVDWPASNVCLWSTYEWRMRTRRTSPSNGVSYSAWTPYKSWYIDHT